MAETPKGKKIYETEKQRIRIDEGRVHEFTGINITTKLQTPMKGETRKWV